MENYLKKTYHLNLFKHYFTVYFGPSVKVKSKEL